MVDELTTQHAVVALQYAKANIVTAQTDTDLALAGGNTITVMPKAGSVVGVAVNMSALLTAGSVTVEVHKDGKIIQRVDSAEIAWTNGSYESNRRYWGVEHEGSAPEPLTEVQFQASYELVKWLFSQAGIGNWERRVTLWEHRELGQFGSASTSCPGGRIPWAQYKEDDIMTDQQIAEAIGRIARAGQLGLDKGIVGTEKLGELVASLKSDIAALKASGGTAPHKHNLSATISGETEEA